MIAKSANPVRVALCFELDQHYHREVLSGALEYLREAKRLKPLTVAGLPVQKISRLPYLQADAYLGFFQGVLFEDDQQLAKIPTVTVSNTPVRKNLSVVCSDDRAVGRMAAEYLRGIGLRRLACLGRWGGYAAERVAGFEEAAAEAGVPCAVYEPSSQMRGLSRLLQVESALETWLAGLEYPCGVFCIDDNLALAVHSLATERGLRIPADLALLGTNNDELLTGLLDCPISSIELNARAIGFEAARLLDTKFSSKIRFPQRIEIPPVRVVVRASTDRLYMDDPVVRGVLERISNHPEYPWTVDKLVSELGVSRRMAEIRFRKQLGCGIYDHLINHRIERAKNYLLETDWPVGRIAEQLGFCDQRQLSVLFKKRTGLTPMEFRRG
jgi:LacI family transcriptional regulator